MNRAILAYSSGNLVKIMFKNYSISWLMTDFRLVVENLSAIFEIFILGIMN